MAEKVSIALISDFHLFSAASVLMLRNPFLPSKIFNEKEMKIINVYENRGESERIFNKQVCKVPERWCLRSFRISKSNLTNSFTWLSVYIRHLNCMCQWQSHDIVTMPEVSSFSPSSKGANLMKYPVDRRVLLCEVFPHEPRLLPVWPI